MSTSKRGMCKTCRAFHSPEDGHAGVTRTAFIIVCHTDHRPDGPNAGYVVPDEFTDRAAADEKFGRIEAFYPNCDLRVEEVS